jgi:hypothetical protein
MGKQKAPFREPLADCVRSRLSYSSEAELGSGLEAEAEVIAGAE